VKPSLSEVALRVWRARIERWSTEYHVVATAAAEDSVHDFRVASRRLRVALQLFSSIYRNRRFIDVTRSDIRDVARKLGPARDVTVQAAILKTVIHDLELLPDLEGWLESWNTQKRMLIGRVSADVRVHAALQDSLFAFLRFPDFAPGDILLEPYLRNKIEARAAPLQQLTLTEVDVGNVKKMHRLRILVKQFRYVLETLENHIPRRYTRLIKPAKELQDILGHMHDWDVLTAQLQKEIDRLTDPRRLVASIRVPRSAVEAAGIESEIQLLQNRAIADGVVRVFVEIMRRRQVLALQLQSMWSEKTAQMATAMRS